MTPRQREYWSVYQAQGGKATWGSIQRTAEICGVADTTVRNALKAVRGSGECFPMERQAETNPSGLINLSEAIYRHEHLSVYEEMTNPPGNGFGRRVA